MAPKFLPRKDAARSEVSPGETDDIYDDFSGPVAQAHRIVEGLRVGVAAVIGACLTTKNALDRFQHDQPSLDEFTAALMRAGVITENDTVRGSKSSKLSKLRAIGEHAELLRRPDIFPHLQPGYSVLYEVVTYYEELDGTSAENTAKLVGILEACERDLTREYLIDIKKRRKRELAANAFRQAKQLGEEPELLPDRRTAIDFANEGMRADLILMTPGPADVRLLGQSYPDENTVPRCLRLHGLVTESAVAVVTTTVRDLPVIAGTLLRACGFPRLTHVLLVRRPDGPDVSDARVIVIAELSGQGDTKLVLPPDGTWPDHEGSFDPITVASRLVPNAVNKLHAFAANESEGWDCIVGSDSWVEKPSL